MFLIAGMSPRLKPLGAIQGKCSVCGHEGRLHIVKQTNTISLFFIPLIPIGGKYIATCSKCASVMEVDSEAGKRIERNPDYVIRDRELHTVQNNHGPTCPHCGQRVKNNHSYCPHCGEEL